MHLVIRPPGNFSCLPWGQVRIGKNEKGKKDFLSALIGKKILIRRIDI